ncbi:MULTISPECIES: hypothetical protein [Kitasatospora]|uniref:Uncharacterized protein n=1 Tax=Kitasatospora setae (strain ATCC 33774 / DSM 43861 / JCM 3304 / KCC A-0304 / NBRC 14216 / KM-6054) TaxID=452652 RepID=E4N0A3_KITSK|nr:MULTISPECIES: hypothetical protein [Kitasatospora]BAJ31431.1 hypothetical protein KSE_56580 [Kitasatospora setae KM-6054]
MSTEQSEQESTRELDGRLARAFRQAGEDFIADVPLLAREGAVRGRRRRGQLAVVAGASALVLAVGAAGAVAGLGGAEGRPLVAVGPAAPGGEVATGTGAGVEPAAAPTGGTATGAALPDELHTVSVLGGLLPTGVRILRSSGSTHGIGTVPSDEATAELTVDNGSGPSLLSVTVDDWKLAKPMAGCTGQVQDRTCTETPTADGGKLTVQTSRPNADAGFRDVRLEAANGLRVRLQSFLPKPSGAANGTAGASSGSAGRTGALLTPQQLADLATAPNWRDLRGLLTRVPTGTRPDPGVRLADLVPAGLKVRNVMGSWSEQRAVLDDGGRTAELRVQVTVADQVMRDWFALAPAFADGTRIRSTADRLVRNAQGAAETVVVLLRPSGLLMRVTVTDTDSKGVLMSLRQVEELALAPAWAALDRS